MHLPGSGLLTLEEGGPLTLQLTGHSLKQVEPENIFVLLPLLFLQVVSSADLLTTMLVCENSVCGPACAVQWAAETSLQEGLPSED